MELFCTKQESQNPLPFYIPGATQGNSSKMLSAAALVGPHLSQTLLRRIRNTVQGGKDTHWVTLYPRECTTLASTLRLMVARISIQHSPTSLELSSLSLLSPSSTVVIYLSSIALHKYTVLNDFIKALYYSSQEPEFPRLVLILGSEAGAASLDDKLDPESIQSLDIKRFTTPVPSLAFDIFIQELVLKESQTSNVWLGPSTMEFIRHQYFEKEYDLDRVLATMEVRL
jgi:hypothetical protein